MPPHPVAQNMFSTLIYNNIELIFNVIVLNELEGLDYNVKYIGQARESKVCRVVLRVSVIDFFIGKYKLYSKNNYNPENFMSIYFE